MKYLYRLIPRSERKLTREDTQVFHTLELLSLIFSLFRRTPILVDEMSRYSSNTIFETATKASHNQEAEKKKIWILIKKALLKQYEQNKENNSANLSVEEIAADIRPSLAQGGLDSLLNANPVYSLHTLKKQIIENELNFNTPQPFETIKSWVEKGLLAELTLPTEPYDPAMVPEQYYQQSTYKELMSDLVTNKVGWRLFVDGTKQCAETAASYDEREPGCLLAMAKAFTHAMHIVPEPLTFETIINLHKLCLEGVNKLNEDPLSVEPFRKSNDIVGFGLTEIGNEKTKTINGYRELCLYPDIDKDYTVRCNRVQAILYGEALEKRVKTILTNYEIVMNTKMSKEERLRQIVSLVALLERIHPFWDANCRTLCVMVLNKELVRHGFPLTILEDPNRFDCFSREELMNEVINGFKHYDYVKEHHCFPGEDVTTKTGKNEDPILVHAIEDALSVLKPYSLSNRY